MHKHVEDDGDLNVIVNDGGQLLVVCSQCKKGWLGRLDAITEAPKADADSLIESLTSNKGLRDLLAFDTSGF